MCARVLKGRRGVRGQSDTLVCVSVRCLCVVSSPPASLFFRSCHPWHGLVFGTTPAVPTGPARFCGRRYVVLLPWLLNTHTRVLNYIIELEYTAEDKILSVQCGSGEKGERQGGVLVRLNEVGVLNLAATSAKCTFTGAEQRRGGGGCLGASSPPGVRRPHSRFF